MKDNLIEMLFDLFEKSLTKLQNLNASTSESVKNLSFAESSQETLSAVSADLENHKTTRVLSIPERAKLSKASHQFLMRMRELNVLPYDIFEQVMNILFFSDSRVVSLEETKWAIRTLMSSRLNNKEKAFLDLILYKDVPHFH